MAGFWMATERAGQQDEGMCLSKFIVAGMKNRNFCLWFCLAAIVATSQIRAAEPVMPVYHELRLFTVTSNKMVGVPP